MAIVNNELVLMALVELSSAQKIGSDGVLVQLVLVRRDLVQMAFVMQESV
jgi:hypothetical protein